MTEATPSPFRTGGCLCGAVRYRLTTEPHDAGFCHCRTCQRTSGAPLMAFATVALPALEITHGTPTRRRSSAFGERWFCHDCGSPLAMHVDHQPETIDVAITSLDAPDTVRPGFHIWDSCRVAWFETCDKLPRYAGFRP